MISKLSKSQLQTYIRSVAANSARLAFTDHALTQMKRRHITRHPPPATRHPRCGRRGCAARKVESHARANHAKGNIECRMEYFLTGRDLGVIVAVSDEEPDLIIVTAMEL